MLINWDVDKSTIDMLTKIPNLSFRYFKIENDFSNLAKLHLQRTVEYDLDPESPFEGVPTIEDLKHTFKNLPNFHPESNVLIAQINSEELIGYILIRWWIDHTKTLYLTHDGYVLHEWRSKGVTIALLRWAEQQLISFANRNFISFDKVFYFAFIPQYDADRVLFLINEDYIPAWGYVEMELKVANISFHVPVLSGIEIKPALPQHYEIIWKAEQEAFEDVSAVLSTSIEEYKIRLANPNFDKDLILIAWDKDKIAGVVVCDITHRSYGVIESISIRKPWRKKGIGMNLLQHALKTLQELHCKKIILICEAQLRGIRKFYERAGFKVKKEIVAWLKLVEEIEIN